MSGINETYRSTEIENSGARATASSHTSSLNMHQEEDGFIAPSSRRHSSIAGPSSSSQHPTRPLSTGARLDIANEGFPKRFFKVGPVGTEAITFTSPDHDQDASRNFLLSGLRPSISMPQRAAETARPTTSSSSASRNRQRDKNRENKVRGHIGHIRQGSKSEMDSGTTITMQQTTYSGPIAIADYDRMKKEVEMLKRSLHERTKAHHDDKKLLKAHCKLVEELKAEISTTAMAKKDQEAQLEILEAKSKADAELISSIESSLQCQICMELLHKPYSLVPCGHILCLSCLQQWFRRAPGEDSDVDSDDSEYIRYRTKTCPCCRTETRRKPVPVFVVKAVVTTLQKAKNITPFNDDSAFSGVDDSDPWSGIFEDSTDEEDDEEDEFGYGSESAEESGSYSGSEGARAFTEHPDFSGFYISDEEDEEDGIYMGAGGMMVVDEEYLTASEDEDHHMSDMEASAEEEDEDEGNEEDSFDHWHESEDYIRPQWEPPKTPFTFTSERERQEKAHLVPLLSRGCTEPMIQAFGMEYTRESGLVAYVTNLDSSNFQDREVQPALRDLQDDRKSQMCRMFLGWNIELYYWDDSGEFFIQNSLVELETFPARWERSGRDAIRLIRSTALDATATYPVEVDDID